jgi:large subunit ribosomal protein L7A
METRAMKDLEAAPNRVVGLKQLLRELEADNVARVYLADDTESHVKEKIRAALADRDVRVVAVNRMDGLGAACGIKVSAACAAILKEARKG